ncbi:MAG: PaaI family thioesterase [Candidatus Thermoplasmatota archaeon]|nr:PaaI family thioesterase [Candidatus Thermoplasmatota archaeon]
METGVQRKYAPHSICFGCGPANEKGLQIDSHVHENGLKAVFHPQSHHQAFPGMLCGGIIGTLLDCHGNWTAAIAIMESRNETEPPCTVTARYSVKLRRPTPHGVPLEITSQVESLDGDRAEISMKLTANGELCAQGDGLFVAVKEGHPAWHRWH